MKISRELEYLEGLVKLARKRKDEEASKNQVVTVKNTLVIRRISTNKNYRSKTMHLLIEINNGMVHLCQ
jgi:hypothetical protein